MLFGFFVFDFRSLSLIFLRLKGERSATPRLSRDDLLRSIGEIHLVHLAKMSSVQLPGNGKRGALPGSIRRFLSSEALLFVGNNIANDKTLINQDFGTSQSNLLPCVRDLGKMAHDKGETVRRQSRLSELVGKMLGLKLPKDATFANWEAPLSSEMKEYAARDVAASLRVWQSLSARGITSASHAPARNEHLDIGVEVSDSLSASSMSDKSSALGLKS